MHEPSDDLTPQEREALAALRGEGSPMALEDRVVDALRKRGAVAAAGAAASERTSLRLLAAAAVAALCVALGAWGALWLTADRSGGAAGAPSGAGDTYVLLLLSAPGEFDITEAEEAQRVQEYSGWAGALAQEGRLLAGEKLADEARMLDAADASAAARVMPTDRGEGILAGFFLIRAADYDEAVAIAAGCPHLQYGGRVEVRRIEPT